MLAVLALGLAGLVFAHVAAIDVVGQIFQMRQPTAVPDLLAPVIATMVLPSVGHTPIDATIAGRGCHSALFAHTLAALT